MVFLSVFRMFVLLYSSDGIRMKVVILSFITIIMRSRQRKTASNRRNTPSFFQQMHSKLCAVLNSQEYSKKKPTYLLALTLERRASARALTDAARASDVRVVFFVLRFACLRASDAGCDALGPHQTNQKIIRMRQKCVKNT